MDLSFREPKVGPQKRGRIPNDCPKILNNYPFLYLSCYYNLLSKEFELRNKEIDINIEEN
jgi:hypothetical protein